MSFFNKIFGKKEQNKVYDQTKIGIDEIERLLKDEEKERFDELLNRVKNIVEKISEISDYIIIDVDNLVEAELKVNELTTPFIATIRRARESYCKSLTTILSDFNQTEVSNIDELNKYESDLKQAIIRLNQVAVKHGRIVRQFFKQENIKINRGIQELDVESSELFKILSESKPKMNEFDGVKKLYVNYQTTLQSIESTTLKINEYKEMINQINLDYDKTSIEVKKIEATKEYLKCYANLSETEKLSKKLDEVEHNIRKDLTEFARPLRKYFYTYPSKSVKEELIKKSIEEPSKILLNKDNIKDLTELLLDLQKYFKETKTSQKEFIKINSGIENFIIKIPALTSEIKELKKKVSEKEKLVNMNLLERYNNHKKKLKDISDQSISFSDKINRLSKMINVENESLSTIGHNFKEKTKYVLNIDLQI